MTEEPRPFVIGIPIYKGVDLMDVAAPYEMFRWMGEKWKGTRKTDLYLIAATHETIETRDCFKITPDKTFDESPPRSVS